MDTHRWRDFIDITKVRSSNKHRRRVLNVNHIYRQSGWWWHHLLLALVSATSILKTKVSVTSYFIIMQEIIIAKGFKWWLVEQIKAVNGRIKLELVKQGEQNHSLSPLPPQWWNVCGISHNQGLRLVLSSARHYGGRWQTLCSVHCSGFKNKHRDSNVTLYGFPYVYKFVNSMKQGVKYPYCVVMGNIKTHLSRLKQSTVAVIYLEPYSKPVL